MVGGYTNLAGYRPPREDYHFQIEEDRGRFGFGLLRKPSKWVILFGSLGLLGVALLVVYKGGGSIFDGMQPTSTILRVVDMNLDQKQGFSSLNGTIQFDAYNEKEKKVLFNKFKARFSKNYDDKKAEESAFNEFSRNLKRIDDLNKRNSRATYTITWFADLSKGDRQEVLAYRKDEEDEIIKSALKKTKSSLYGYWVWDGKFCVACNRFPELWKYVGSDKLPESFDWRDYDAVTKVRNQGACGDCWAFASADDMASTYYLANKDHELVTLSAQELTSCDFFDYGCNGGIMYTAYEYTMLVGGLLSEHDYPYEDMSGAFLQCELKALSARPAAKINFWTYISGEKQMLPGLIQMGPMAAALNAESMLFYESGIDTPTVEECDPDGIDHAILVVGYGSEDGMDYWIIKNSWGKQWGMDGYYKIIRGVNACGIGEYPLTSGFLSTTDI